MRRRLHDRPDRTRGVRGRGRWAAPVVAVLVLASGCQFDPADTWSPEAVEARAQVNALLDQAEAHEANGDDEAAAAARAEAADIEAEVFLPSPPVGTTTVHLDPARAGGFFDAPWPSDTRLRPDGSLDLGGFPGRSSVPIADLVLGRGAADTYGFGLNSAVYFRTTGPLDPASLPLSADFSVRERSTTMLLDLDHPDAPPVPLLVDFEATGTPRRPSNLLTLLPYPGHPLQPGTRYAAVVFNGLRAADGTRLAPSPTLAALDGAAPPAVPDAVWATLRADRDEVSAAVRGRTMWHPSEITAFTAFTTQAATSEMAAIATSIEDMPAPEVLSSTLTWSCFVERLARVRARVALPIWQAGTRPYLESGGDIVVGADGRAVAQGEEMGADGAGVVLDVAIPCGPAPAGGWPVLLWMDGTGASAQAVPISEIGLSPPYAVFSIAPLYSGDRTVEVDVPPPLDSSDFLFFNYLNPLAARTNAIQQAADMLYLERIVHGFAPHAAQDAFVDPRFDLSRTVMAGHSQGATTLPLTLAHAPAGVRGGFLSASGAGLYHSVVYRDDVRRLIDGLVGAEPDEIDIFHPYPQILQTFAEAAEPANYASAVTADVLLYGGLRDGCTAIEVNTHLATALGIPIVTPQTRRPLYGPDVLVEVGYQSPFEPMVVAAPVSGNLPGGRTGAVVQVDAGHFGASSYPSIGRSFIDSIAAGGPTVIDPGPTPPVAPGSSCPRFGPPPTP